MAADEELACSAADRGPTGARRCIVASGRARPLDLARLGTAAGAGPARLARLPEENRERLACDACGFIAYVNPRLVVTTIPVTADGGVILLRRGIEPGRGWWRAAGRVPRGRRDGAEAAARETLEETGLLVVPGEIVGLYSRLEAAVVVVAFERASPAERSDDAEALEVRTFEPAEIPWGEIAFRPRSTRSATGSAAGIPGSRSSAAFRPPSGWGPDSS